MKTAKILTVIFLLATMAMAGSHTKDFKNKGGNDFKGSLPKELKLTSAQTRQLEEMRKAREKDTRFEREKLQRAKQDLRDELFKANPSLTSIEIYKSDIIDLQRKQLDNMAESVLELKKVLTPEQLEILKNRQGKNFGRQQRGDSSRGSQKQSSQKGKKSR